MVETRVFSPSGVGLQQKIHYMRWATRAFAAGVVPVVTNFFSAAPNADFNVDLYEQGNALVGSGSNFTISQIGVQVVGGAAATFADFESVINGCSLRIITASKEYGIFPFFMMPQGGGIGAASGQVSVTAAAAPGGAGGTPGLLNGVADRRAMFALAYPLTIQANQGFYCEMLAPTGGGVVPQITLTGALRIRVVLDGELDRSAS